jgi:DNA-directed RNA polymerase specialized sigma24 family protein
MLAGPNCNCLICRLEADLITELGTDCSQTLYLRLAASCLVLSGFPTTLQLIRHLHRPEAGHPSPTSDEILRELLGLPSDPDLLQFWHSTILLAFIPTIHRTSSHIGTTFPSLTRDDIAQHLIATLLESLYSSELRSRQSHLAFTVARRVRRLGFRWAIHESRTALRKEAVGPPLTAPVPAAFDRSGSALLLCEFLDSCERRGWLSSSERHMLMQCKIEGISCQELSRQNGHSPVALQHRIQRLIDRLRRLTRTPTANIPRQLELFLK